MFDSFGQKWETHIEILQLFVQILTHLQMGQKWKEDCIPKWKVIYAEHSPRQENNYDCGAFLCLYALEISRMKEGVAIDTLAFQLNYNSEVMRANIDLSLRSGLDTGFPMKKHY